MARLAMPMLLAFACGCFPAVTHGARVEDGLIGGVMVGATSGPMHVEGDEGGIRLRQAVIGPFVGYGRASPRPSRVGYYIGAAVPLFIPFAQVDAYLQLPPALTGPVATGFGFTASAEATHGYAMLGGDLDRSRSWYLAGGYGSRYWNARDRTDSPAWFGNAGVIAASGYLRTQLFVQFASGRIPGSCFDDPLSRRRTCDRGAPATAVSIGVAFGRHQHNARQGRPY